MSTLTPEAADAPTTDQLVDGIGEAILAAHYLLDDSEQRGVDDFLRVPLAVARRLEAALDALEDWPDEPGFQCGPAASAQWAIKCALQKARGSGSAVGQ